MSAKNSDEITYQGTLDRGMWFDVVGDQRALFWLGLGLNQFKSAHKDEYGCVNYSLIDIKYLVAMITNWYKYGAKFKRFSDINEYWKALEEHKDYGKLPCEVIESLLESAYYYEANSNPCSTSKASRLMYKLLDLSFWSLPKCHREMFLLRTNLAVEITQTDYEDYCQTEAYELAKGITYVTSVINELTIQMNLPPETEEELVSEPQPIQETVSE